MIRLPSLFAKRLAALVAAKSDVRLNVATDQGVNAEVSTRSLTAVLTGLRGLHLGYSLLVTSDHLEIGRDPDCDLCFPADAYVSGNHALLFLEDGEWFCTDVGSTNRTFLGGQPIGPTPVVIPPGGVLRFGMQALQIDYAPGAFPVRSAPPGATAAVKPKPAVDLETACWLPPNVPTVVGTYTLPGGLVYVGEHLPKIKGGGVEPALIIPSLKVGRAAPAPETRGGYGYYWSSWYWSSYETLSAGRRRMYLEWLAGERQGPVDEGCLFLFLYGLERRALAARQGKNASPGELAAIRTEVERLAARYPNLHSFRQKASHFLSALGVLALMSDPTALPDAETLLRLPRGGGGSYYSRLPVLLDVVLARFAAQKRFLPADYAWAWYLLDPEISPRTPALRCPDEMRGLFTRRYEDEFKDGGVRPRAIKTPVSVDYQPANPSLGGGLLRVGDAAALLHRVSSTPLNKQIAPLAERCADELDGYSRALARDPSGRGTFPVLALLPADVLQSHAGAAGLKNTLEAAAASAPNALVVLPARDLLAHGGASWQPASGALAKSDAVLLAQAAEKLGFLLEPDVRVAGIPANAFRPDGRVVVARRFAPAPAPAAVPDPAPTALAGLLAFVAREAAPPETAGAEKQQTTRREESWRLLDDCLNRLPPNVLSTVSHDRLRLRARLLWLIENPEGIKPPRRNTLPELAPAVREQVADLLVFVALASGGGATSLATIKTLVRAFVLLGLDESLVYAKVHGRATAAAPPPADDLVSVAPASPARSGFALPPSSTVKRTPHGKDKDVAAALDRNAIARSLHESAKVSELLAGIFTDDENATANSPAPEAAAAPDEPTVAGLDARHAELLARLRERNAWTAAEFAALAREAGLPLPAGALETLNDAALETIGETVLDGDDLLIVNRDVIQEMFG